MAKIPKRTIKKVEKYWLEFKNDDLAKVFKKKNSDEFIISFKINSEILSKLLAVEDLEVFRVLFTCKQGNPKENEPVFQPIISSGHLKIGNEDDASHYLNNGHLMEPVDESYEDLIDRIDEIIKKKEKELGAQAVISPKAARRYIVNWKEKKIGIKKAVYNKKYGRLKHYVFDSRDTIKILRYYSENPNIELYIHLGIETSEDYNNVKNPYPQYFIRVVIELQGTETVAESEFFERSSPCPPNCKNTLTEVEIQEIKAHVQ